MKSSVSSAWVNDKTDCTDRYISRYAAVLGSMGDTLCEQYGLI